MKATLRRMGNSQGVLIPKAVIAQLGIEDDLEMLVENNAIVLRKPEKPARNGWAQTSPKDITTASFINPFANNAKVPL
jgi:antitoxin MazE